MAESLTNSEQDAVVERPRRARGANKTPVSKQRQASAALARGTVHPLHEALCCEARNCLQVILSGAEILIEDHVGNLLTGQKDLLSRMSDNARHVSRLLSTVVGEEEFALDEQQEKCLRALAHAAKRI
jgi:hypothetical protein